jgi:toxin-antitoxin system PIN domain toxin
MIAVDTNLLVHAHRADSPSHAPAVAAMQRLAGLAGGWALPWPCAHEFVAVVTGRAYGAARSPTAAALDALDAWLAHPRCRPLAETARHAAVLRGLLERAGAAGVAGPAVHDARIAAICLEHGVAELWTSDRDFARFPDLRVRDPLIPALHEPPPAAYAVTGR